VGGNSGGMNVFQGGVGRNCKGAVAETGVETRRKRGGKMGKRGKGMVQRKYALEKTKDFRRETN